MANHTNPQELLAEILISKERGELTPRAIEILSRMVKEMIRGMRYKYDEDKKDCMSEAMFDILKYWQGFDPNRPNANCFSYYTQLIKNGIGKGFKKLFPQKTNRFVSMSLNDIQLNI